MTCYNHEAFVGEAIESVINQSLTEWELLVADDASQDRSAAIIAQYAQTDARIKPYFHAENQGKSACLNDLIPQTSGDYVTFIDSDDLWLPHKLEEQLQYIQQHPAFGAVYSDGFVIDVRSESLRATDRAWLADVGQKRFSQIQRTPLFREGNIFVELIAGNFILYSSFMVKRGAVANLQFEESRFYSEDWLFFIELSHRCSIGYIEQPLVRYRVHGKNLQNKAYMHDESTKAREVVLAKYGYLMSCRTRAGHWRSIGNFYRHSGDYRRSSRYLLRALFNHPFDRLAWAYLIHTITRGNKSVERLLTYFRNS
jgi:glycosyltransferase involved in cell wall biosynthesis